MYAGTTIENAERPRLRLPAPRIKAYQQDHRIPGTNRLLEQFGFDSYRRDLLFAAYGVRTVRRAIGLYLHARENPDRQFSDGVPSDIAQAHLVALMESLRTSGELETFNAFVLGTDIVGRMRGKYSHRDPITRIRRDEDVLAQAALEELVKKFFRTENYAVQQPS